jgi:hypothetical protein
MVKGQDLLVAFHLAGNAEKTLAAIGKKLGMSYGEVHSAVGRLQTAQLLLPDSRKVIRPNLKEFVLHGARYVFPAQYQPAARGVATGNLAAPLAGVVLGDELALVWKHPQGTVRAQVLVPIYKDAPTAALADPVLHSKLALFDGLRAGGARAREIAAKMLSKELEA